VHAQPHFLFSQKDLPNKSASFFKEQQLINHLKESIKNSYVERSNIKKNKKVLKLEGMSSKKVRHLLNNLCGFPKTNYLEIGTWKGSTLISALFRNEKTVDSAIAIDNFSESGGPKKAFFKNCKNFIPKANYKFYLKDSFKVNKAEIFSKPINIYFYDGHHSALSHEKAFTYFDDVLDDVFITIIDDWNCSAVREGTYSAFEKLKYDVLYEKSLYASHNGDSKNWWNGMYVAVIRKKKL
jgi:hypothetical protein